MCHETKESAIVCHSKQHHLLCSFITLAWFLALTEWFHQNKDWMSNWKQNTSISVMVKSWPSVRTRYTYWTGMWPINSVVTLQNGFHHCVPLTRENAVSSLCQYTCCWQVKWVVLAAPCQVCSDSWDIWLRFQLLAEDSFFPWMNDFFFFFTLYSALLSVKRPIMRGNNLGKIDNCCLLGPRKWGSVMVWKRGE